MKSPKPNQKQTTSTKQQSFNTRCPKKNYKKQTNPQPDGAHRGPAKQTNKPQNMAHPSKNAHWKCTCFLHRKTTTIYLRTADNDRHTPTHFAPLNATTKTTHETNTQAPQDTHQHTNKSTLAHYRVLTQHQHTHPAVNQKLTLR